MTLNSHKKNFPIIGVLAILSGVWLSVMGVMRLDEGDPIQSWGQVFLGICIVISWTSNVMNQIVEIVIDDEVIEYRRRKGPDLVIHRSDLIDSEVHTSCIKFRYKGPLDVRSASIPLRRFEEQDVEKLKEIFTEQRIAQQGGRGDGDKPPN
jgi:hypothetical protein